MRIKVPFFRSKIAILLLTITVSYAVIFSILSITRHEHFYSHGWDMALYEQIIWKYSNGQIAFSSLTNKLDFADRFRPSMLLVVPFYKIWPNTNLLLIIQALLISFSAFPIFLLALRRTNHKILSLIIASASILFVGSQSLIMNDFHELGLLPIFLASAFLFLDRKQWKLYFLMIILALGVREYIGFIIISLGISLFFMKISKKIAVTTFILGFVWSFLAIFVIMPYFGESAYKGFLGNGQGFGKELTFIFTHPAFLFYNFFQPNIKIQTMIVSLGSFAFLPLLCPPLLLPIIIHFLLRFLDLSHQYRWTYYFQYSADLSVLLAVATIYSSTEFIKIFKKIKINNIYISMCCTLFLGILSTQIFVSVPIKLLLHKEFFQEQSYMFYNNEMLKLVPAGISIAAQNNLAAHLGARDELSILPEVNNAEYIAIDLHSGQNEFDFYGLSYEDMRNLLKKYQTNNLYKLIYHKGDSFLLKRNT